MSESILPLKDDGYTSPDFLANLFKKPLYCPVSLTSIHSTSDETKSTSKENSSSPLFESTQNALKTRNQNRIYRSLSIIDDEKIQSKKYKIFFKTLLYGRLTDEEINEIWIKLQCSISNPFEFDKLIQNTKARREVEMQTQNAKNRLILTTKVDEEESRVSAKAKSIEKKINQQFSRVRYLSLRKKEQKDSIKKKASSKLIPFQRKIIQKEVSSIKAIIFKNESLIRKKTL